MKFLVEIEIRGPLEAEIGRYGTVEACLQVEQIVRDGFLTSLPDNPQADMFLTVRAMEHVTVPKVGIP